MVRQNAGLVGRRVVVVKAAYEFCDRSDAEEVISIGEKPHAGNDNRFVMVKLSLGIVESRKDGFFFFLFHPAMSESRVFLATE